MKKTKKQAKKQPKKQPKKQMKTAMKIVGITKDVVNFVGNLIRIYTFFF
ncbi:hypothetical protein BCJMU51_p72 (plasmid) [Bacillus cereus]|nr:hypothetical protein [Bacillus cereus]BCC27263.1 hypothetical protein BCM0079_p305 [Bacillus cereus]BCC27271.1 hypothetical protein BCM0079_p313 [Bacillus cereus]BCC44684.1 hypothetical protein BCJMU01_p51 [Bacillus cereus]BCC68308.1 hypothetical protein BCJMU39_p35 [Bacillus cereus]BCC74303.1 hypothetical protein BCJMU51_p72 [Bacillus cereus]